jgi:cytochrome c551
MILGKGLYTTNCLNCHQQDGKGLHGIIPPLAQSDYLKLHQRSIACLINEDSQDTIIVNGTSYLPQMPAHNFSSLEIAEVITFINNSWGNEYGFVPVRLVDKHLNDCK